MFHFTLIDTRHASTSEIQTDDCIELFISLTLFLYPFVIYLVNTFIKCYLFEFYVLCTFFTRTHISPPNIGCWTNVAGGIK